MPSQPTLHIPPVHRCVKQHQWEAALTLAEGQNYPDLPKVLAQYASHLLAAGKQLHAVELYRKANQYTDAARLLRRRLRLRGLLYCTTSAAYLLQRRAQTRSGGGGRAP